MSKSKAEKADSHDRIVRVAAARFRECGIDGIGVADLMKEADLTHGGFYRHFASRDDLVAEAVERALHEGGAAMTTALGSQADRQVVFGALIDAYLSTQHRDALASSCAVTTMAGDVARCGERTRTAYTRQVEIYLEAITAMVIADTPESKRAKAIAALSTLVGAVSLARAVNDEKISKEILKSAADVLKAQISE
jgi:TetR/AcrR family transcriptional regulator, transcriptional repressor for nem operon